MRQFRLTSLIALVCATALLSACTPTQTPPTPGFTLSPATGSAPLAVQFNDTSATGSAPITAWAWNFGDGQASTARSPLHTYQTPGTYDVTLTVTTAVASRAITRTAAVTVGSAAPPVADFNAAPVSGTAPLAVQFTDTSTPGSQPITAWLWNFGDGQTGTDRNPTHAYAEPGAYTVSLRVTTAAGQDTRTRTNLIAVAEPGPDPALALTRVAAGGGVFTPGGTLDITVTLTVAGAAPLTALGLLETLPAGWAYVEIVSGPATPAIVFPRDGTDDIEFAWYTMPAFPASFTYRVAVPADAGPEEILSGVALFRAGGTELRSNAAITVLTRAAGSPGA